MTTIAAFLITISGFELNSLSPVPACLVRLLFGLECVLQFNKSILKALLKLYNVLLGGLGFQLDFFFFFFFEIFMNIFVWV